MYESVRFYRQVASPTYVASPTLVPDAATTAWINAVIANGGTVSGARRVVVNSLIVGLKADGVWTGLDLLSIYAAENTPSALTDMKALTLSTAVSSPTFATDLGYTGNGSSSYIDSNFNISTATNFQQDSGSHFGWSNTGNFAQLGALWGLLASGGVHNRCLPQFSGSLFWSVNESGNVTQANSPDPAGLYFQARTGATAQEVDINGTLFQSDAAPSSAVPNTTLTALSDGTNFSSRQICCLGCGTGFNATDRTKIYNRLRTYMTAVGVP